MEIEEKEIIMDRAKYLVEKYDRLDMIYLRVSTKDKGQREEDQDKAIIKTFDLDLDKCLVIKAKESAFQKKKDKFRKFNIFYDLIETYKDYDKRLFVWDLDRIYRNQKKQAYFISYFADKNNCIVLSYRQKFLHQFKNIDDGLGRAMYNFMIEMFGYQAEDESKKKGERLLKSLTKKGDRYYTNKGNMFGRKLIKKILNEGKDNEKKIYFNQDELDNINIIILKAHNKGYSYRKIVMYFKQKKDISLSVSYVYKIIRNNKD